MPDHRSHRGPHPEDQSIFAADHIPALRAAVADLCWLESKGYAVNSALKLVGDRYALVARQRAGVGRAAAAESEILARRSSCVAPAELVGKGVSIDAFNVILTLETALGGGVVLGCCDGCYRDLASMHGTYRKVEETLPAVSLIGEWLDRHGAAAVHWFIDRPVSNSGRLKGILEALARERDWPWLVDVVYNPDNAVCATGDIVASSDRVVIDRAAGWVNLARQVATADIPGAWVVDLDLDVSAEKPLAPPVPSGQ